MVISVDVTRGYVRAGYDRSSLINWEGVLGGQKTKDFISWLVLLRMRVPGAAFVSHYHEEMPPDPTAFFEILDEFQQFNSFVVVAATPGTNGGKQLLAQIGSNCSNTHFTLKRTEQSLRAGNTNSTMEIVRSPRGLRGIRPTAMVWIGEPMPGLEFYDEFRFLAHLMEAIA